MAKYIIKRLLLLIPTIILVTLIVFVLMRMLPGSAVDALVLRLNSTGTYTVDREDVEAQLGLDKPIAQQYLIWLWNAIHGDLGDCFFQNETVVQAIGRQIGPSLELGILTLLLTELISIPLGLFCAARQDTISDYTIRIISLIMMSVPMFFIATVVLIYPAIWWGYSPPADYVSLFENPIKNMQMFLIPAILGAITQSGMQLRTVRTVLLDNLRSDYVRTVWAKGAKEKRVVFVHGFRNAMIPVITLIGGSVSGLIGGSVILENLFNIPGIGQQVINAINNRDYMLVQGCILVFSLFTMLVNLLVDISYKWIDPRVSLDNERRSGA